jgi:UDP-N-acetylmuramate--alanine ligase
MINLSQIKNVYFLGIGGIGMSALARYFNAHAYVVGGYDRIESDITIALKNEGIDINYVDKPDFIPDKFHDNADSIVVFTPAISSDNQQKQWLENQGLKLLKRAEVLGLLSENLNTFAVAGTHGKTTVSTMLAWLMQFSDDKSHAFLGGISKNFQSNYVDGKDSLNMVVEADEFDRSFLHLHPVASIITSTDADHLDIYGTHDEVIRTFNKFANQNQNFILLKQGVHLDTKTTQLTYALEDERADFYAHNLIKDGLCYQFDLHTPNGDIIGLKLNIPGELNLENAVAASAMALLNGLAEEKLANALLSFCGIKRRFEIVIQSEDFIYIDDYAHHPTEILRTFESLKSCLPDKKLTAIFQPHLFSRTNDFYREFAMSLSGFDHVLLLPIYPAREKPMPGVSSELILNELKIEHKILVENDELLNVLSKLNIEVLISLGAGDIDRLVPKIKLWYEKEMD